MGWGIWPRQPLCDLVDVRENRSKLSNIINELYVWYEQEAAHCVKTFSMWLLSRYKLSSRYNLLLLGGVWLGGGI